MNNLETNRVNMINSSIAFCDANPTATSGITNFAIALAAVKAKMLLINGYNQIGSGNTKGVTADTNNIRGAMSDLAMKCASGTMAYANATNNNTLKEQVSYSRRELDKFKKEDIDDVCQGIHDAADANIANITGYGVSATDVSDLQAAINLYRAASQNPRLTKVTQSQAKKQAAKMVGEVIKDLLKGQMDVMVNTLKLTNASFVEGYYQAREIIDLGSTSAKVRGEVRDENTAPLRGVVFSIYETGTEDLVKEVVTDAKGNFNASKLPMGNFDFVWSLSGYKTVKETDVHIGPGKELKRKIVMEEAIVREGQFTPGKIENVDLTGVDETITKVTLEAMGTNFQAFGSNGPGNGPNGNTMFVSDGQVLSKSTVDFANETSFMQNGNTYLNVQNTGSNIGRWRLTFEA